ncbi:MAG TPA: YciI family protein [Anaeromyxobacteraceae bacterium]|nr:YciI family protein [Anaeromyxobacteraceae bacterium]
MQRFLYFYLMRNAPEAIRQVVPAHVQYWHGRSLPSYLGGPFADRTGGLITFGATSLEDAKRTVEGDPFVRLRLVEQSWVKEWRVE